jgi:hypothetical protein
MKKAGALAAVGEDFKAQTQVLVEQKILGALPKEYGRFNADARKILCALAKALQGKKGNIGIIFVNDTYCVEDNFKYYKDFIDAGAKLGRANLFVYTLPTTPVAEAAIYFGLTGPLFYLGGNENLSLAHKLAADMVKTREAQGMAIVEKKNKTIYAYLVA